MEKRVTRIAPTFEYNSKKPKTKTKQLKRKETEKKTTKTASITNQQQFNSFSNHILIIFLSHQHSTNTIHSF